MNKLLKFIALCTAALLFSGPPAIAAQDGQATIDVPRVFAAKARPIRAQGQASATVNADRLSVNLTMQAGGETIEDTVKAMQALRAELAEKAASTNLKVVGSAISSVDINRARGNDGKYKGRMQMTVRVSGFEDPLSAIGQLADNRVSRIGNMRYSFSEELLAGLTLCDKALADATAKAEKRAAASGRKLGAVIDQECHNRFENWQGRYSSETSRTFNARATVTFAPAN